MSGHTPGPWHSSAQEGPKGKCFVAQVWHGNGQCLAEIEPTEHQDEATATARLIASSPEMLQRLDDLVVFCIAQGWTGAGIDAANALLVKIRGAA